MQEIYINLDDSGKLTKKEINKCLRRYCIFV